MSIEIIQVQEPEAECRAEWAWNRAKERSYLDALAAPAAVVAAPFIATTAATVGAAAAGGVVISGASEILWGPGSPPAVTFYSADEAEGIVDAHGNPLARGHPTCGIRIKAKQFESYDTFHQQKKKTTFRRLGCFSPSSEAAGHGHGCSIVTPRIGKFVIRSAAKGELDDLP